MIHLSVFKSYSFALQNIIFSAVKAMLLGYKRIAFESQKDSF
jgi:hypothetical protein